MTHTNSFNVTQVVNLRSIRSLLAAAVLLALAAPGLTQTPGQAPGQESKSVPVSKVERKNKAPVSKDVLRVKLPKPVEATLDNGLTVLIMEDHRFPTASVQLNISGAGPIYEPANLPGLANITAQMLREGTTTRTSKQIAEDVDKLGATLFASSGFGSAAATISASGLSDNIDEWFALATDILLNPTFPADELNKLKQRLKVQLRQQRSQPFFLANERFSQAVFGNHPAAVVSATPESLDAITSELLSQWHQEHYVPQNAILGIAGDVHAAELIPKLKTWLSGWQKTDLKEVLPPNPAPASAKKIYLVNRPNSVQTTIAMGNIAIDRRHPDYISMVVMNRIVGGGPSARLFLNLREEKGYTYGVYSNFTALKYPGPWRAGGDVRTEVTDGAMTEFFNEIRRIREEKVPEAELEEAKRSEVASFALSLEQPTQLLSYAITRKIYGLPDDYWDTYPAKLMAVTADDVQRIARKYINPEAIQIVAVGDGSKIKAVLEKYGPVEVYDTEGKPASARAASTAAPGQ
jgi:predicted Zn-dependent peptidase